MRTIKRQIVGAIIIAPDDFILLGQRPTASAGVYPGCWLAPGGGVEDGESHIEALRRELNEEVGLPLNLGYYQLLDDKGRGAANKTLKTGETVNVEMEFFMYAVRVPAQNAWAVTPSTEFATLMWFQKSELANIQLSPPGLELFQRLGWIEARCGSCSSDCINHEAAVLKVNSLKSHKAKNFEWAELFKRK